MTLLQTETVIVWCPVWAKSRAQSRSFSHTKNAWGNCEIWSGNSLVLNRPMLSISSYGNIFCSRYLLFWKHRCSSTHIIMLLYKRMITNMTKIRCLQTSVHNDFRAFREMQRCREQRCAFLFFLPCPHPPPPPPQLYSPWKIDAKIWSICMISWGRTIWSCSYHWIPSQARNNRWTSILERLIA